MGVREDERKDTKSDADQDTIDRRFRDIDANTTIPGFEDKTDKDDLHQSFNDIIAHETFPGFEDKTDKPVASNEAEPDSSWVNNTSQNADSNGTAKVNGRSKKGPLALLISLMALGGFGLTTVLTPATLLINLKENLVNGFDTQNTSMTIRMNKVIANKLAGDTTTGLCTAKITIACKFSRPSNNFLSKLADNGIVARGADGKIIEKKLLGFPNTVPETLEFTDKSGTLVIAKADEFATILANNDEFRSAFHKAFNPRWVGYADSVATKVLAKFGASKSVVIDKNADTAKATEALNTESAGKANAATEGAAAGDAAGGVKTVVSDAIQEELNTSARKVSKAGADPALTGATFVCLGLNAPGFYAKIVRDYQMIQLIKYGIVFMTVADAMKAGKATPEQVASIGTILTSVYKDSSGKLINGSAMDSFGIKYALYGDTKTTGFKKNYADFIPGGKVNSSIPGVALASDPTVQQSCSMINSPQAQVAATSIEAAVAVGTGGVGGIAIAAIKAGGKAILALGAINEAVKVLNDTGFIKWMVGLIPTDKLLSMLVGDLTKNLQGEDAGNALASGVLNYMGQTANAGGNAPLSKSQAVAYSGLTSSVNLAYAKEDRATLSPLDASSPNTFLGSIVTQMLPYSSELSSGSGTLSFFGNLLGRSFSYLGNKATAATNQGYSMCRDPSISSSDIAAGPFCNIIYGIPVQYINESTADVLSAVSSQIDQYTGDPIPDSKLATWLSDCTTGEAYGAPGCEIKDKQTAEYALYFIDHRIQKNLDGEEDYSGNTANNVSGGASVNADSGALIGDLGKQFYSCAKWIGGFVLPTYFGIANPGGNGDIIASNLGTKDGYVVDHTPAVHAIVSWPAGGVGDSLVGGHANTTAGHVAIVYQVNADGSIEVEEHNYTVPDGYDKRHIGAAAAKLLTYAHVEAKFK